RSRSAPCYPRQHVDEAALLQRAEQRVPGELRAGERRAAEAAEEAGGLARLAQGLRMGSATGLEGGDVEAGGNRRNLLPRRQRPGMARETEAAVPARIGAFFAEVADELVRLAAVVRHQIQHLLQPRDLVL